MDSECSVCYCEQATCKLVCNHTFCKACVKTWYQKSEEPTCPMCRHPMYFKGLHRMLPIWEKEKTNKRNEEAFNAAFDIIFDEDSDFSESESESEEDSEEEEEGPTNEEEWEEWTDNEDEEEQVPVPPVTTTTDFYSKFILEEIIELQKEYQKAMDSGIDFDYYIDNIDYIILEKPEGTIWDLFPHEKNLLVSNHKNMIQNKRTGSRVPSKCDNGFTISIYIEC